MKTTLKFSILLNVLFSGVVVLLVLTSRPKEQASPPPAAPEVQPPIQAVTSPAATEKEPVPFHWGQLDSGNDYRLFIANLRAIGCPENTIEDIVRGNFSRAFAWKRRQLGIDGSGSGPWSQWSEMQLISSLLGESTTYPLDASSQSAVAGPGRIYQIAAEQQNAGSPIQQNGGSVTPGMPGQPQMGPPAAYPSSPQYEGWSASAYQAGQSASISQEQQSLNGVNGQNQNVSGPANPNDDPASSNPNDSANPDDPSAQNTQSGSEDPYAMSAQDYMAQDQQQYDEWFKPQVTANSGGGNLNVNPLAFSPQ